MPDLFTRRLLIGIDPKLTGTGLVAVDMATWKVRYAKVRGGKGWDLDRMEEQAKGVAEIAYDWVTCSEPGLIQGEGRADEVLIGIEEQVNVRAGWSQKNIAVYWLMLHWLRESLWAESVYGSLDAAVLVAEIPPKTRAKFVTMDGNASKQKIGEALSRDWHELAEQIPMEDDDVADALALALTADGKASVKAVRSIGCAEDVVGTLEGWGFDRRQAEYMDIDTGIRLVPLVR